MQKLGRDFFVRDTLEVAPALLGKYLVRVLVQYFFETLLLKPVPLHL